MTKSNTAISALLVVTTLFQTAWARHENPSTLHDSWQLKTLHQPGKFQQAREARGFVNIYDGLSDVEVDKAMDTHFERIENMMFTRIQLSEAAHPLTAVSTKSTQSTKSADSEDCD
jgi:hypothetical protein